MSVVIFIIVLSILIIVHEWGHFITAKSLGIVVERFAIGFGPKIYGRVINNTEFALCLVPLGGYVKMAGDERSRCTGSPGEYYSRPPWQRALVISLGSVVNYLLAFVCFCAVFVIGYPTLAPTVGKLIENYPAEAAGLQIGDTIIGIDGKAVASWEDMRKYIIASRGDEMNIMIDRGGQVFERVVVPRVEELKSIFGQREQVRLVGIEPQERIIVLRYGPLEAVRRGAERLWEITTTTYRAIYRMVTGGMSAKDSLTGPIGIFYILKTAAAMGFSYLLYIVAVISASLAIFNLLPFPVLDGGHLLFLGIEKLRGKPLAEKTEEAIQRIGITLIICLAIFVLYSDIVRFGWVDKIMGLFRTG